MLLGIAGPFQPGDAVTVEIIDIIQYPVFSKRAFAIFDYGFNTLSEYSDNVSYTKFFIIRTFSEKPGAMRLKH